MNVAPPLPDEIWVLILDYVFPSAAVKTVCKRWLGWHRYLTHSVKVVINRPLYHFIHYPRLEDLVVEGNVAKEHWSDLERITTLQSLRFVEGEIQVNPPGVRPRIPLAEERRHDEMQDRLVAWASRNPRLDTLILKKPFYASLTRLTQLRRLKIRGADLAEVRALTRLQRLSLEVTVKQPIRVDLRSLTALTRLRVENTPYDPLLVPSSVTHLRVQSVFVGTTVPQSRELLRNIRILDIRCSHDGVQIDLLSHLTQLQVLTLRGVRGPIDLGAVAVPRLILPGCTPGAQIWPHPSTKVVFGDS